MNKYCMIEVAFDNMIEVNKIIDVLLSKKLVASIHIIESKSSWNWKGKRENSKEYLLQITTKINKQSDIYNEIKKIHSYECFEFAIFGINTISNDYIKWIDEEVN